jgi:putative ABC transport system substrate-binding protein
MRRRAFISTISAAAVWHAASPLGAQQPQRVGVLFATAENEEGHAWLAAIKQGLRLSGWSEERGIELKAHWGSANPARIEAAAAALVSDRPAVIVVRSSRGLKVLHRITREVPIVFISATDPVRERFVESLAKPGGNITGFTLFEPSIAGKLAEILKEIAPHVTRAGLIFDPQNVSAAGYWRVIEAVAPALRLTPVRLAVKDERTIAQALAEFAREPNGGLLLPTDATTTTFRDLIVALAAHHGLPAAYTYRSDAQAGGLVSYGPEPIDLFRRAGAYAGRILNGERPAELPVQTAERFEMAINLRTAAALGLPIPPTLLARADEVIE